MQVFPALIMRGSPAQPAAMPVTLQLPAHPCQQRATQLQPARQAARQCTLALRVRHWGHHVRLQRGSRSPVLAAAAASRGKDRGSQPGSQQGQCPLHACLLRHGIADLSPFSAPKHLGLSQEVVSSNVEPKLVALTAEGLSPAQMVRLLAAKDSPLGCSFGATFQPNLELLGKILALSDYQPHP
jgi:hypothetical protein